MGVVGVVALLVFGPDQLPKVARRAGKLMRDVQNTSQSFIREMERAADDQDVAALATHTPSTETVTHSDINPYAEPVETPLYSSTPTGFEASGIVPDAIVSADGPLTAAPAYHAAPAPDVAPPKYVPPPSLAPRIAHFSPEPQPSETGEPAP